jgi:putative ABC transport system substrate-binding protein
MATIKRRDLLTLLGGAAGFWPLAGAAQQPKMPTIGVLVVGAPGSQEFWRALQEDLRALGYVEGRSVRFEFRSDEGQASRLPELAAELVHLKVDLIVASPTPAALAAKQATTEIPIVISAGDPVATGLVQSLARPGGNVTGFGGVAAELAGKCVELIRDMMPSARRVAALANAPDPFSKPYLEQIGLAGAATGTTIDPIMIHNAEELEAAFPAMEKNRTDAVIVQPSLPTKRAIELALKYRIPAVAINRAVVENGGLMGYWSADAEAYARVAAFVDKILKGAKPADLPVERATRFKLVINMKTAKALGLTIPPAFLARADEVIE